MRISWGWSIEEVQRRLNAGKEVRLIVKQKPAELGWPERLVPARDWWQDTTIALVQSVQYYLGCFEVLTDLGRMNISRGDWLEFLEEE